MEESGSREQGGRSAKSASHPRFAIVLVGRAVAQVECM